MEDTEVLGPSDWTLAELEAELRTLAQDGLLDSLQADAIRRRIDQLEGADDECSS